MVWFHLAVSVECFYESLHIRLELFVDVVAVLLVEHLRQLVPEVKGDLRNLGMRKRVR